MLSAVKVKTAKPAERAYKLADSGGLFLLVQPNGSKLWRYKFRIGGVEGLKALGAFPEVGLADARAAHAASRHLVAKGINPVHARRAARQSHAFDDVRRARESFEAVYREWDEVTSAALSASTAVQRRREIEKDLLPAFQGRSVASLTRLELTMTLKAVEARAPEVARNLRNHLWRIFEYAIDTGLIEDNPVPPVRVLRKRSQQNHPALDSIRLRDFMRQLDATESLNIETRIAMRLVVLTACRKNEVVGARWSEFDLAAAAWEIPAERMKARRAHWVPLSRQAVAAIRALREVVPEESALLFPNRVDPTRQMADRSLNAVMERLGYSGVGTPHGMRAAFSTHFNSAGANVDVIEHCLAHVPANRVRAAYNRHQYQEERRLMLQAWADFLEGNKPSSRSSVAA